jgi:6-phospho-beta-glucosidase
MLSYGAMGGGVKVCVIGAGSSYTPELVEGLLLHRDRLSIQCLALHDIDGERLEIIGALTRRILARGQWEGQLIATTSQDEAIDGADFVVVQLRVGGQAARYRDETLPLQYGCIGQETTGAGGFAKALRTVPVVLGIAEHVERRAAKGAWIVDFTNPVGIVSEALLGHGHRAIGLCNVGIGFQRQFARHFGVEPRRVQLAHVGLNHLSWERAVLVDGKDRLPELLEGFIEELSAEVELPAELIRLGASVPSYYLRYYYMTRAVLEEQLHAPTRAEHVMDIERRLFEMYQDPKLDRKPDLLAQRGGAYYSDAATELMASLQADTGDVQVVDVRNDGAIPDLPKEAVVEVSGVVDSEGAHPLPVEPLPPEMAGLVRQVKSYEMLTVKAAESGSRSTALKALMANPLVADFGVAEPMLGELLTANRSHLPRFFGEV